MKEQAPQPSTNFEPVQHQVSADGRNLMYQVNQETGKKTQIAQANVLDHYGYDDRATEQAKLDAVAPTEAPDQITVLTDTIATNNDAIKQRANWQMRVNTTEHSKDGKPSKQGITAEDIAYNAWLQENATEAKGQSLQASVADQEKQLKREQMRDFAKLELAVKTGTATGEDAAYYYTLMEQAERGEGKESQEQTVAQENVAQNWTAPDPATANKGLPRPPIGKNKDTLDSPEPTIIEGINNLIEDIQRINPDDFKSKWSYDQEVDPLKDELFAQVDKLGLGGKKRADLVKAINERLQAGNANQEPLANDNPNMHLDSESADNPENMARQVEEELDQARKAQIIVQEEIKRRLAQEDEGQGDSIGSEWGPVMEAGNERSGKLQRIRQALGKVSLKNTLEFLGFREKNKPVNPGKTEDNTPRKNKRLTEIYGIGETTDESKKETSKAVDKFDELLIASRERGKRIQEKYGDALKRHGLEPEDPYKDFADSLDARFKVPLDLAEGAEPGVKMRYLQGTRQRLIEEVNTGRFTSAERAALIARIEEKIPYVESYDNNALSAADRSRVSAVDANEANKKGKDAEQEKDDSSLQIELARLLNEGKDAEASIVYDQLQRQIERKFADNPEAEITAISSLATTVGQMRSDAERKNLSNQEAASETAPIAPETTSAENNGNGSRSLTEEELEEMRRVARGGDVNTPTI